MSSSKFVCAVCGVEIQSPKLTTIGNQVVCSLACVGLLAANKSDACDYCKRPVWKDNYYVLNNKYYCREKCKNQIQRRSKLQEKNIQHIKQNVFPTNNLPLKNSQQLREDVLKIFKDFKFESTEDFSPDNRNKTPSYSNNFSSYKTNDNSMNNATKNNNNQSSVIKREEINDTSKVKSKYGNPLNDKSYKMNNSTKNNLKNTEVNANSFRRNNDNSHTIKHNHTEKESRENYKIYKPSKTIVYRSNNVPRNNENVLSLRGLNINNPKKYNNHQVYNVYYKNPSKINGN